MDKKLNIRLISTKMLEKGLSQQDIAEKLDVSKAAVSKWLKPESFPKPSYLLKLGKLLGIPHAELVSVEENLLPQVAFRKSGNYKITDEHLEQFQFVATLLKRIYPYLPFDKYNDPSVLSNPSTDYKYIQEVAGIVRKEIASANGEIEYTSLISLFAKLKATLIPVLWDKKSKKNGTHIYLPDTKTTWIFLNIDSSLFDFKFWMAHELGHAKAPQLMGENGEEFADRFAGALLFPEEMARETYEQVKGISDLWQRVNKIVDFAFALKISPITIYYQLKYYCDEYSLPALDLEQDQAIFRKTTEMNARYENLSQTIFKTEKPTVKQYLTFAETGFGSTFFQSMRKLLKQEGDVSPKFISNVLDISLADAYEIMKELVTDEQSAQTTTV